MADLINNCSTCFEFTLSECVEGIKVSGGLIADTEYFYRITDKFGNRYTKEFTTDIGGAFLIDPDDFPAGLFTKYAGSFILEVSEDDINFVPVELTFCEQTYKCIKFDFVKDDLLNNEISCNDV